MPKPLNVTAADSPLLEVHIVLEVIADSSDEGMYPGDGYTVRSVWLDKDRAEAAAAGLGTFGTEFPDEYEDDGGDDSYADVPMGHVQTIKISR